MISTATAILGAICVALGAYMFSHFCVTTARRIKREKAESDRVKVMQEVAYETGAQIYKELKDPATREAEAKKILGDVYTVLKASGSPIAEQFKVPDVVTSAV